MEYVKYLNPNYSFTPNDLPGSQSKATATVLGTATNIISGFQKASSSPATSGGSAYVMGGAKPLSSSNSSNNTSGAWAYLMGGAKPNSAVETINDRNKRTANEILNHAASEAENAATRVINGFASWAGGSSSVDGSSSVVETTNGQAYVMGGSPSTATETTPQTEIQSSELVPLTTTQEATPLSSETVTGLNPLSSFFSSLCGGGGGGGGGGGVSAFPTSVTVESPNENFHYYAIGGGVVVLLVVGYMATKKK